MAQQVAPTERAQKKSPTRAFVLSLVGGVLIFAAGATRIVVTLFASSSAMPYFIEPAYKMLKAVGEVGGSVSYFLGGAEAISGVLVIAGAMMIHHRPAKAATWGNLVLAFSFVSFVGTGGFVLGAVLGIVGGSFALLQKPNPPRRYLPPWPHRRRGKDARRESPMTQA